MGFRVGDVTEHQFVDRWENLGFSPRAGETGGHPIAEPLADQPSVFGAAFWTVVWAEVMVPTIEPDNGQGAGPLEASLRESRWGLRRQGGRPFIPGQYRNNTLLPKSRFPGRAVERRRAHATRVRHVICASVETTGVEPATSWLQTTPKMTGNTDVKSILEISYAVTIS
jgi:hypothetical protein